jgi:hypothetical protein
MRTLVAGWFSFENGHYTAGDLFARDIVCEWLGEVGYPYDVALASTLPGGIDWHSADPRDYPLVVFVCGPFQKGDLEAAFLGRFAGSRLIGVNLSMDLPLAIWNPFDYLIERDSSEAVNADIVFLSPSSYVPLVGLCLVEPHPQAAVDSANALIERLVATREASLVRIDTRMDVNESGLRTPVEIESLIARMDAIVTTRLHGLVLALKNGVPVIAIDAVPGGGKIRRQAAAIGWPLVFTLDDVTDKRIEDAFDYCFTDDARELVRTCNARARRMAGDVKQRFVSMLSEHDQLEGHFRERNTPEGIERFLSAVGTPLARTDPPAPPEDPERATRARRLWASAFDRLRSVARKIPNDGE